MTDFDDLTDLLTPPKPRLHVYHHEPLSEGDHLCRYEDEGDEGQVSIRLLHFRVLRRTRCGTWIDTWGREKFVLDGSGKRYAYPTREAAWESFKARKTRQERILNARHAYVLSVLELIGEEEDPEVLESLG